MLPLTFKWSSVFIVENMDGFRVAHIKVYFIFTCIKLRAEWRACISCTEVRTGSYHWQWWTEHIATKNKSIELHVIAWRSDILSCRCGCLRNWAVTRSWTDCRSLWLVLWASSLRYRWHWHGWHSFPCASFWTVKSDTAGGRSSDMSLLSSVCSREIEVFILG